MMGWDRGFVSWLSLKYLVLNEHPNGDKSDGEVSSTSKTSKYPGSLQSQQEKKHTFDNATVGKLTSFTEVILSAYVYMVRRPVGEAYWCAKGTQAAWMLLLPAPFLVGQILLGPLP